MKCIYCQNVIKKKTQNIDLFCGDNPLRLLYSHSNSGVCVSPHSTQPGFHSLLNIFFLDKQMLNIFFFFIGLAGVFALFLSDL